MVLRSVKVSAERAFIIGIQTHHQKRWEVEENLSELAALTTTAGATVIDKIIQEG